MLGRAKFICALAHSRASEIHERIDYSSIFCSVNGGKNCVETRSSGFTSNGKLCSSVSVDEMPGQVPASPPLLL